MIKSLNGLKDSRIHAGQQLQVQAKLVTPVATKTSSEPFSDVYTVRPGDTLGMIASRFGTRLSALQSENALRTTRIQVGQKLKVPGASGPSISTPGGASPDESYTVKRGDSLWSISKKFGVNVSALKRANKISGSGIHPGQKIKIP
jgi:LysM repeat protein